MADKRVHLQSNKANSREKKRIKKERFLALVRDRKLKKQMEVSSDDEGDEYFIWEKYLERQHAKPVPKTAFKHVKDTKESGFKSGMKVEAKDQTSSNDSYWVATIVMVSGPLLLLRFDGYNEDRSGDFWLDASSELLQPIGWCAKTNNILVPPEAIRHKNPNWAKFLVENLRDAVAAPDNLFHKDTSNESESDSQLKVGRKVELQDVSDPLRYWPAVIVEKYGARLRLRYFGYEEEDHDIWDDYLSHHVHNLGWGRKMGLILCPPEVMDKYLQWKTFKTFVQLCQSQNSRQTLKKFEKIPKITGVKPGMKLEIVNPLDPSSMCTTSIKEVLNDYFFTVDLQHGSATRQEYIYHAQSKYLYPSGWCEKNNVPVKPAAGISSDNQTLPEPAPDSLFTKELQKFKAEPAFNIGDIVEVLDNEDPSCYWVATVTNYTTKYNLRYCPSTEDFSVYRFTDSVHPLGWCRTMGLRFKPPKGLQGYKEHATLLGSVFDEEDAATNVTCKQDKEDTLPPTHGFKPGMQLEAVNPQDPSSICVASVIECNSEQYFTLQIDDFIENNNQKKLRFWCQSNSKNIFPVGWCKKNNVQLTPPPGNPYKEFIWEDYIKSKKTSAAPESLFCQVSPPSSDFEVGLKLEAVDQTNPQTISVATVTQIIGGTLWVRLDGYQSNAVEQIYDVESYNLFPVGWSSNHGHPLLGPKLKSPKNEVEPRKWSTLLRKRTTTTPADSSTNKRRKTTTKATNTSKHADKPSKSKDFSISIVVKSSDKRTTRPTTPGAATPSSSTGDDSSRQEVCSNDDTDTATEDETPKPTTTIDLTDDYSRVGDKELLLFIKKSCSCGPYLNKNRLLALPDTIGPAAPNIVLKQVVEHVVICSSSRQKVLNILSSEKEKQSFLSILKTLTVKLEICENLFSLNKVNTCSRCDKDHITTTSPTKPTLAKPSSTTNSSPNSTTKPTTRQPSKLNIPLAKPSTSKIIQSPSNSTMVYGDGDEVVGKIPDGHISGWSMDDVIEFVTPRGCKKFASVFQEQEVDGKALMLLSLDDIHKVLGVTLGPAIKLHDDVQKLRYKKN
ncbi:scm-like with four MBT domains protein 2 isoform X2 [Exaiptasia diaphana]|uniref:SAM domain-containing protein n=1 Tax=Exaiptasia diaphana TaxID=2652724 RepID=A0A913YF85_EXADI|nr:scm-like with four MBT domains protein 2 isoform X2 [Exaiptasia diaphana]